MTKPVNVENLEMLLQAIWNGDLEHDQENYFCGTACCLAGLDVVLNSPEQPQDPAERPQWYDHGLTRAYADPFQWSQHNNNLNFSEALLLFHSKATKKLHILVLEALKAGRRLSDTSMAVTPKGSFHEHTYEGSEICIGPHTPKDREALAAFLGVKPDAYGTFLI
jgi:hypothetical protein